VIFYNEDIDLLDSAKSQAASIRITVIIIYKGHQLESMLKALFYLLFTR